MQHIPTSLMATQSSEHTHTHASNGVLWFSYGGGCSWLVTDDCVCIHMRAHARTAEASSAQIVASLSLRPLVWATWSIGQAPTRAQQPPWLSPSCPLLKPLREKILRRAADTCLLLNEAILVSGSYTGGAEGSPQQKVHIASHMLWAPLSSRRVSHFPFE